GGCRLVAASAGEPEVAAGEARVVAGLCAAGAGLGEAPWERWLRHRYDLSADRLRGLLQPAGAFVDTIEVAAAWSRLPALYAEVKAGLVAGAGLALCHFSHAYPQGCCAYFTFAGSAPDEAAAAAASHRCWSATMAACLAHGATIS